MVQTVFTAALLLACLSLVLADEPGVLKGRLAVPGSVNLASATIVLQTATGVTMRTYPDSDGTFTFNDVPAGSHMLHPHHMQVVFPEVRVDMGKQRTLMRASYTHQRQKVLQTEPMLMIGAVMEAQYFEKRRPVDIWSFIKSPYGIMIVVSLFAIFVFPNMKVDPEEFKEMQSQLKGTTSSSGPSAGNALPASRGGR